VIARQINDPVYDVRLDVIASCSAQDANKFIKRKYNYDPELDGLSFGTLIQYKNGKHFIMWLKSIKNNTIVHEVSHLIDDIYSYRDIQHDCKCSACSEHKAYQTTGWVDIIKKALKK
jgi:hypothetical protein